MTDDYALSIDAGDAREGMKVFFHKSIYRLFYVFIINLTVPSYSEEFNLHYGNVYVSIYCNVTAN